MCHSLDNHKTTSHVVALPRQCVPTQGTWIAAGNESPLRFQGMSHDPPCSLLKWYWIEEAKYE